MLSTHQSHNIVHVSKLYVLSSENISSYCIYTNLSLSFIFLGNLMAFPCFIFKEKSFAVLLFGISSMCGTIPHFPFRLFDLFHVPVYVPSHHWMVTCLAVSLCTSPSSGRVLHQVRWVKATNFGSCKMKEIYWLVIEQLLNSSGGGTYCKENMFVCNWTSHLRVLGHDNHATTMECN